MKVNDIYEAWDIAKMIMKSEYHFDPFGSIRSGSKVWRAVDSNDMIIDLNTRLEITINGKSKNIWYA